MTEDSKSVLLRAMILNPETTLPETALPGEQFSELLGSLQEIRRIGTERLLSLPHESHEDPSRLILSMGSCPDLASRIQAEASSCDLPAEAWCRMALASVLARKAVATSYLRGRAKLWRSTEMASCSRQERILVAGVLASEADHLEAIETTLQEQAAIEALAGLDTAQDPVTDLDSIFGRGAK